MAAGTTKEFTFCQEHTFGSLFRTQLLLNDHVLFAAYKVPHPMKKQVVIIVTTDHSISPDRAFEQARAELLGQVQEATRSITAT